MPLDETGQALWARVEGAWQDEKAHDAFVEHCTRTMTLAEAAARYRQVLDAKDGGYRDPSRAAEAERRLDRITKLAVFSMQQERSDRTPPKLPKWVLFGVGFVVVLAIYAVMRALGR